MLASPLRSRTTHAELRAFRRGSWSELRAAHQGHATIVHFWGLTCGPCLVELPRWGAFRKTHTQANIVLVAADPMPQTTDALMATLRKAGLDGVESWSFQDRFTERLFWEVDRNWQGELPFTVLLAPDGRATTHLGEIDDFAKLAGWLQDPSAQRP